MQRRWSMNRRQLPLLILVLLALAGALLAAACGGDPKDQPPLDSRANADGSGPPGGELGPDFIYAIEDPVLECRGGATWLSILAIGPVLGADTVLLVSPVTPAASEGSFNSVGGLRPVDATVTSSDSAAAVIGDRPYFTEDVRATTVEAQMPRFIVDSGYAEFQVVLLTKDNEADRGAFSNGLRLATSAAQC